jgi:dihydrofolate synthase/folylpolyglutamate synthase
MADNPRATPTAVLAEEVKHYINYQNIMETDDVETAINKSLQIARGDDVVCITGSLYTVGEAKAYFLEGNDRKR